MSRPVILTEAQLCVAVAVAEAVREERIASNAEGAARRAVMTRPEYDHASDWGARFDAAYPAMESDPACILTSCRRRVCEDALRDALETWADVRPDAPFEVRAGETLARIVAEKTDGGTECRARDGLLSEVLREFEGREVRDGAR